MDSSNKIIKGVAWTSIVNIVNGIYGFVSVPILIAYFGKSNYGLIGLAMSINIYLRLMDLGFNSTNIRFFSNWIATKQYSKVNLLFKTSISFYGVIGLINSLALVGMSFFTNQIFALAPGQDIILKHLLIILAISAFISWYTSCFDQLIKANEQVAWTQQLLLLPKVIQMVVLGLTVLFLLNIEWYYALTTFALVVQIPFMVRKIKVLCPYINFKPHFNIGVFKEVFVYSINIFSFGIFQFSILNLRPVFLGIESSPEAIADFRIMNGIVNIVILVGGAFLSAILPSASKVVALNDKSAQDKIIYQGTKFITITLCFCCFGVLCVVPELIQLYVGKSYLYLSYWLDLWLLTTLGTHNQAISSLILAQSDIRSITYCTILSSIIGLLVCWFTIPLYSVGGTVIGYGMYLLIQLLFYYLYYWPQKMQINSKRVFFRTFLPFLLIGMITALICRFVPFLDNCNLIVAFVIKGMFFSVLYMYLSYYMLNKNDKQFILRFINRK